MEFKQLEAFVAVVENKSFSEAARQLNLMGGGSRNALLCQLTADRTGVPVIAGPVEASALGSLIAQLEVLGYLDPAHRNAVIAATARTVEYRPRT